jgi:uncharacterized glyoxalase superfamily protein PhnB
MRNSIVPWLNVRKSAQAVEFYKAAFGAVEVYRIEDPDGNVVARLSVEGAEFWVGDESPEHLNFSPESLGGSTVRIIFTVADPDAMFERALKAAQPVFLSPAEMPLMVAAMARLTSGVSSPARLRRSRSTWMRCMGST